MTFIGIRWPCRVVAGAGITLLASALAACSQSGEGDEFKDAATITASGTVAVIGGPFQGGITPGTPCTNLAGVNTGDAVVVLAADGTILAKTNLPSLAFSETNPPSGRYPVFGACDAKIRIDGLAAQRGPYSIQVGDSTPQVLNQNELEGFEITTRE